MSTKTKMIRWTAVVVAIVLAVIGLVQYDSYRKEQAAFEAMGEAQLLREQLRQPEESK